MQSQQTLGKYRILSIDGGGARSIIPAIILFAMEKELGALNEFFNLFSGNSSGALFSAALAFGLPASNLNQFYSFPTTLAKVFQEESNPVTQKFMKADVTAKYSNEGLK